MVQIAHYKAVNLARRLSKENEHDLLRKCPSDAIIGLSYVFRCMN